MKIRKVEITNFRGYKSKTEIDFNDFTVFIGKNDVGKSTILQALDIFFNEKDAFVKLDENDFNVFNKNSDLNEIVIGIEFDNLPNEVIIDATNKTTLENEYLLTKEKKLKIIKKSTDGKKFSVYIETYHPIDSKCSDLLIKKNSDLKKIIDDEKIENVNKSINADMRKAIWEHFKANDNCDTVLLDVSKKDGDLKQIWDNISKYLPIYSLFQSDRKNDDNDSEVQDPLKEAVKIIMSSNDIQNKLNEIATEVKNKLQEVSDKTLSKLREMDQAIANNLHPYIPNTDSLKWSEVFKNVSIVDDMNIPINKRGSGVKRLILINFFRAQVENKISNDANRSIIYAIEEPETSQHIENQKILIDSFISMLNANQNIQIIITTHSGFIVKQVDRKNLRVVSKDNNDVNVENVKEGLLPFLSLNEINYELFGEVSVEYFDELYGFIGLENKAIYNDYKKGKEEFTYIKIKQDGNTQEEKLIKTKIIRNQIHHPENKLNTPFTDGELVNSIIEMREHVKNNKLNEKLE